MANVHIRFSRFSAFYTPLLLTMSGGHLEREGLSGSWDITSPDRPVDGGIADGSVQVAQSATAVSFEPYRLGAPLTFRHFAVMNLRDGFFLARRGDAGPFEWSQLEGHSIVADHYFQPMALLRCALTERGVDISKVSFIDAGDPAAMELAFRSGTGDYLHMQGPAPQQLDDDGIASVVASVGEASWPIAFSTLVARPDWLTSPDGAAFGRAFASARVHAQTGAPAELARLVAEFLPSAGLPALERTIATYQAIGMWTGDLGISPELYAHTVRLFRTFDDLALEPPYGDLVVPYPSHG
jgi:NitT/TauT family transport system substrate-binding protein